jgi:serralysin
MVYIKPISNHTLKTTKYMPSITPMFGRGNPTLDDSLRLALNQLSLFSKAPDFLDGIHSVFGDTQSIENVNALIETLIDGGGSDIKIVADLGGARGAYSIDQDTIYLSEQFLLANKSNSQAIADVLLEEIGHSIDSRLNDSDTAGDEGELFAALVTGKKLSSNELAAIRSEDDRRDIVIDGELVSVEAAAYGSINVDGNLTDWTAAERLDTAPNTGQPGYEVYGKYAASNYVFAIKSAVAIGNGSTIWIDADRNAATGYQIFGFAGGAEFNIQIGLDGKANLYSGGEGQTLVSALDYKLSADGKNLEVAVAGAALGATAAQGINVLEDVNNSVYLPGDYSQAKYTITPTGNNPSTNYGSIALDGNLADWKQVDRLDYLPGTSTTGYQEFGKSTADGYVFAINSAVAVGAGTTIWLDTDQNKATGFQIFGTTPTSAGAEYNINIAADGNAYLYTGGPGQNLVAKVDSKLSADGKQWEVGVSKNLLPVTGAGINILEDVNNTTFLPGDYNRSPFTISNTPLPARTDLSKKVGIVYSETSASKFFDRKAYDQLFANAQNQAMQAGINFDILTETDLKDLSKVVQYDSLVFSAFGNVKAADAGAIESVLTQASFKYGVGLIAAGDFMTNDETGAALAGDPYQRLKNLFDVSRTAGGTVTGGSVSVNIKDTTSSILESSYTAGEQIASYTNNLTFGAYSGLTQAGTVLADQTVNGQKYNAVIATQTGGRNVHFADQSIFADSNLGWQGLEWSVYGNQAKVGLDMTRNKSIFVSRDDVDQSKFSAVASTVEAKVGDILAEWKTKYNFVGSHYINIGNNPANGESTDWAVMKPIYQKWLDLGNEIGTHSYTHPFDVNNLTDAQLEFEFNQSKQIIAQQLGVPVNGAGTPGNPDNLFVDKELSKYFQYVTGVGSAYTNSFGYLEPGNNTLFFGPNISFDFNLIEFKKLTAAQAEAVWAKEYAQLTKHGNTPFILFPWHDYGITEKEPGYTKAMFENFIARAASEGTEFVTLDDAQQRIRAFDAAKLTTNQVGDTITAQVTNASNIGKFAVDIDAGAKVIKNVTNYYAYDNDSVFTTKTGGNFTINLGTGADDVTHITSLDQRMELVTIEGDGTNLDFDFNGAGKIVVDMIALGENEQYAVDGADSFKITGDKVELTFNNNQEHSVSVFTIDTTNPSAAATKIAAKSAKNSPINAKGAATSKPQLQTDALTGTTKDSIIVGADPNSATPGRGKVDTLQGTMGKDRFVLGDSFAVYYNDGNPNTPGINDYGSIEGFTTGDVIQLKGKAADYTLTVGAAPNGKSGTLIQSTIFGQPELVGFVAGGNGLSLTSSTFSYV